MGKATYICSLLPYVFQFVQSTACYQIGTQTGLRSYLKKKIVSSLVTTVA